MSVPIGRKLPYIKTSVLLLLLVLGVVWFIIALFFWWQTIFNDPKRAFNDMIERNFTTAGYSRMSTSIGNGVNQVETAQIQFGQRNIAETHIVLKSGESQQNAEVISTPEKDFVRYTLFKTPDENGKLKDSPKVQGVWAQADRPGEMNQSFARQTLFATYFPMGLVPAKDRSDIISFIDKNTVYSPNYKTVKTETMNGRKVFTYAVSVQLQTYVPMLQKFAVSTGQGSAAAGLNPNDYAGQAPVKLDVSIDAVSHRLVRVSYNDNENVLETYGGYGITNQKVSEPKKHVSMLKLQELFAQ